MSFHASRANTGSSGQLRRSTSKLGTYVDTSGIEHSVDSPTPPASAPGGRKNEPVSHLQYTYALEGPPRCNSPVMGESPIYPGQVRDSGEGFPPGGPLRHHRGAMGTTPPEDSFSPVDEPTTLPEGRYSVGQQPFDRFHSLQRSQDSLYHSQGSLRSQSSLRGSFEKRKEIEAALWGPVIPYGGNNYVFCGGSIVFGPQLFRIVLTTSLLCCPFVLYMVLLIEHQPLWMIILSCVVFGLAIVTFGFASVVDPGIMPKRVTALDGPLWKDVEVGGVNIRIRYCPFCKAYRGPRAHHCSVCNNCVEVFDHHCPWTGTCVGRGNYHHFLYFVHSVNLFALVLMGCTTEIIYRVSLENSIPVIDAFGEFYYIPMILMIFGFVLCFPVTGLMLFHHYLVGSGLTTLEHLRAPFGAHSNPFKMPFCLMNYNRFFGGVETSGLSCNYNYLTLDEIQKTTPVVPPSAAIPMHKPTPLSTTTPGAPHRYANTDSPDGNGVAEEIQEQIPSESMNFQFRGRLDQSEDGVV